MEELTDKYRKDLWYFLGSVNVERRSGISTIWECVDDIVSIPKICRVTTKLDPKTINFYRNQSQIIAVDHKPYEVKFSHTLSGWTNIAMIGVA